MATNSPRSRTFFLTINKGASCYKCIREKLQEGNFKVWTLIKHDKDIDENGELKVTHYHAIVELKNPRTFLSIQKQFDGAHIVIPDFKKSTYQYLLHNSPNSKDKYQYDFDEIISNNKEYVKTQIEGEEVEPFLENRIMQYLAEGTLTALQFVKRFGFFCYKQNYHAYSDLWKNIKSDNDAMSEIEAIRATLESGEV